MSINHFLQRQSVKRDAKPAVYSNELSIGFHRTEQKNKLSQKGITVRLCSHQRKLAKSKERYYANRESRMQQIYNYRKANPEKVKQWHEKWLAKNPNYLKEWIKKNKEKMNTKQREYFRKKRAAMTPEQKKQAYQDNRANMIEKHGLDGWRAICAERNRKSRQKRNQNESSKS